MLPPTGSGLNKGSVKLNTSMDLLNINVDICGKFYIKKKIIILSIHAGVCFREDRG